MKEIIKRIIVTILVVGLAIVTAILVRECIPIHRLELAASIVFRICGSIAIIAAIIGIYMSNKAVDQSQDEVDIGQLDRERKEYRERAKKDYEAEKKRILRFLNWGTVYFWFIYLTLWIGMTALFLFGEDNDFRGLSLVFLVWIYGLNGCACLKIEVTDDSTRIKENEYPVLTKIVKDVFLECGIRGRIRLYRNHNNVIAVARTFGVNHVNLGALAIALLDEQELRQMLYHEAAHIKSKDIHVSYRLAKGYEKWNHFSSSGWGIASIAPVYLLCYLYNKEYILFDETSSHTIETMADRYVTTFGDNQLAVNGLAKLSMFDCSLDEYVGDGTYFYLRKEQLEKGTYRRQIREFIEVLTKKEVEWRKQIENYLLEDTSSHPTFSERKAIMEVENYQICFKENAPAYEEERNRFLDAADQELYGALLPCYDTLREEEYVAPMAKITAYKAGKLGNDLLTKLQIAALYEEICLHDEAYTLYEEIRKEDPQNATAAYGIGRIKLMRKDHSGIQDIYDSLGNHNDTDEKLGLIGDYCVAMGLADEYEYWKQIKNDKLNYFYNRYEKIDDCWDKEILSASDLAPELIDRRQYEILQIGQGMIDKIYLVKKQLSEDCKMNTFLLRPKDRVDEKRWDELMDRVFLLLDNDGEENIQYGLRCLRENPQLEVLVSKVEGACIYWE